MQEELQSKLVEILTSIQAATGKAADFAMDQLPEIAQSYVVYGRASSIVTLAMCLGAVVVAALIAKRARDIQKARLDAGLSWYDNKKGVPSGDYVFMLWMACLLVGVPGFIAFAASVQSALLVWFAPKVWLLKELAQLVK